MDRPRTLSDYMWSGLGLSSDSDKPKDEDKTTHVTGERAGSAFPELADASNRDRDSQAVDNCSSEDERNNAFSMASKVLYQGQGNSAPQGAVKPNEVVNPTFNSNGKPNV